MMNTTPGSDGKGAPDALSVERSQDQLPANHGRGNGSLSLFFFGGIALGALLAAAVGFDLFPQKPKFEKFVAKLEQEKRELEAQIVRLRSRPENMNGEDARRSMARKSATGLDLPDAAALLGHIDQGQWQAFAEGIEVLLAAGERGFDGLIELVRAGMAERFSAFRRGAALFPVLRVIVAREKEVNDFLSHALVSRVFREDIRLKEWLLRWGAWFVAGSQGGGTTRGVLQQSLDAELKTGDAGAWVVLESLRLLEGAVPLNAIRELLEESERDEVHGFALKQLGSRADAEAVRIIDAYIRNIQLGKSSGWPMGDTADLRITVALESLAGIHRRDAEVALEAFMSSSSAEVRDLANLAYFTSTRSGDGDLDILLAFLNGGDENDVAVRMRILTRVLQKSPGLFVALRGKSGVLRDATIRRTIETAAVPVPAAFGSAQK